MQGWLARGSILTKDNSKYLGKIQVYLYILLPKRKEAKTKGWILKLKKNNSYYQQIN